MYHYCHANSDYDDCGIAVDSCYEDGAGHLWVTNNEYTNRVSFCPFCGYKAKQEPEYSKRICGSAVHLYVVRRTRGSREHDYVYTDYQKAHSTVPHPSWITITDLVVTGPIGPEVYGAAWLDYGCDFYFSDRQEAERYVSENTNEHVPLHVQAFPLNP